MPGLIMRLSCCLGVSIPRNQGLKTRENHRRRRHERRAITTAGSAVIFWPAHLSHEQKLERPWPRDTLPRRNCGYSLMVKPLPSKQVSSVRFRLAAPIYKRAVRSRHSRSWASREPVAAELNLAFASRPSVRFSAENINSCPAPSSKPP